MSHTCSTRSRSSNSWWRNSAVLRQRPSGADGSLQMGHTRRALLGVWSPQPCAPSRTQQALTSPIAHGGGFPTLCVQTPIPHSDECHYSETGQIRTSQFWYCIELCASSASIHFCRDPHQCCHISLAPLSTRFYQRRTPWK